MKLAKFIIGVEIWAHKRFSRTGVDELRLSSGITCYLFSDRDVGRIYKIVMLRDLRKSSRLNFRDTIPSLSVRSISCWQKIVGFCLDPEHEKLPFTFTYNAASGKIVTAFDGETFSIKASDIIEIHNYILKTFPEGQVA